MWILTCAVIIILSLILVYKCQEKEKRVRSSEADKGKDKKSKFYEKNLTEGVKLSLNNGTESKENDKDSKNEPIKGTNDTIN